ncbi:MAG: carboxypeptidase regulatory-like domain-containing protein [Acidobacteriota bacterium]
MLNQGKGTLILLAAFLCFSQVPRLFGQNTNAGEIRGTVTDSSGAVIPGVAVSIRNVSTNVTINLVTNSAGIYDALSVQPGEYVLTFSKEGFERVAHTPITLRVGIVTIDAQLRIGSTTQEITVQETTPLLQTESAEHSSTVTSVEATELPNVGSTWWRLTTLIPGNVGSGDDIRANGQRGYSGAFFIDGGTATFVNTGSSGQMKVPDDAIAEIKFSTSNFGAESGNGLAAYNVITKSGTNQFHGSLFEFNQNDKFNSNNYFSNLVGAPKPIVRWNSFGGSIGGPIRKNKVFFYFTYNNNPIHNFSSGFYSFPTAAAREGDFSDLLAQDTPTIIYDPYSLHQVDGQWVRNPLPGNKMTAAQIDPVSRKIEDFFPTPNQSGIINNYYWSGPGLQNETWYNGRVDYNINDRHRLNVSVLVSPEEMVYADPRPQNENHFTLTSSQAQISHIWTVSPTVVNELRLAGNLYDETGSTPSVGKGYPEQLGLINTIYDIFPVINVGGAVGGSGIGGGIHTVMAEGSFNPSDTVTWMKGKHLLKFGGQYDTWFTNASAWGDMSAGNFSFTGVFTSTPTGGTPGGNGLGYADFLFGTPNTWSLGWGSIGPKTGSRMKDVQAFVQDDYKIRPNITLNLGVRWLYQGGWTEQHDRLGSFDPTLMNPATGTLGALWFAGQNGRRALQNSVPDAFAPRVGIAWSPKPGWVVRGGYGIYDIMWVASNYQYPGGSAYGWAVQGWRGSTDGLTPPFTIGPTPAAASMAYPNLHQGPTPDAIYVPSSADRPASLLNGQPISYSPADTPMGYMHQAQFSIQHSMGPNTVVKAAWVFSRGVNLTFNRDINQVPENLLGPGDAQPRRPYPQYDSINAILSDGMSNYNSLQASFQRYFSGGLSVLFNYTLSKSLDTGTGNGWSAGVDTWQIAASPMANYGLSSNDETHLVSGSFVYELPFGSGKRFFDKRGVANAVIGGWQLSSMFRFNSGPPFTPVWAGAQQTGMLSGTLMPDRIGKGTLSNPTIAQWFDTSAFVKPVDYHFGNSGRNILRAPGLANMDLSLAKNFALPMLGEGGRLQLRFDATNAFNITNWGAPSAGVGAYGAGEIWSCGAMRQAQVGARLSF